MGYNTNRKVSALQQRSISGGGGTLKAEEFLQQRSGRLLVDLLADVLAPPISFGAFCVNQFGIALEPWQEHLCARLQKLTTERGARILIHKMPRAGGSTIVSRGLPAYVMGRDPLYPVREFTHSQGHSEDFSDGLQSVLRSPEYQAMFPATKLPTQTNVREWSTTVREVEKRRDGLPSYMALGIEGAGVGVGGRLIIIDDPYASPEEAHSASKNDGIKRWHQQLLKMRLTPETNVVVMYHRYQPEDYMGWLEANPAGTGAPSGWEVIRYAGLADEVDPETGLDFLGRRLDESFAPVRFPWAWLNEIRESDPDTFYGLIQGLPHNPEGSAVRREWFLFQYDHASMVQDRIIPAFDPKKIRGGAEIYWDIGASASGDETVGTVGCDMADDTWTWLWQFVLRMDPFDRDNAMIAACQKIGKVLPVHVGVEEGFGLGQDQIKRLVAKLRMAGVAADTIPSKGSKWARATDRQDSFRSVAQAGRILLYEGSFLSSVGLTDQRRQCWEPFVKEVSALKIEKVGDAVRLRGKDNKFDSASGLHNALLSTKLKPSPLTLTERAQIMRQFMP
jgi:hypothetical protein